MVLHVQVLRQIQGLGGETVRNKFCSYHVVLAGIREYKTVSSHQHQLQLEDVRLKMMQKRKELLLSQIRTSATVSPCFSLFKNFSGSVPHSLIFIMLKNCHNVSNILPATLSQQKLLLSQLSKEENVEEKYQVVKGSETHLTCLANMLKCSEEEVTAILKKHPYLLNISLGLIKSKINVFISYGFFHKDIREKPRFLFNTSVDEIKRRLTVLEEHDVLTHSNICYLLECETKDFVHGLQYVCDNKMALEGFENQLEYLQHRLNCSVLQAEDMFNSYPLERGLSSVKLKRLLDFFLEEAKVSPRFVMTYRKLLTFSTDRLRLRLKVMEQAGVTDDRAKVYVWSMTKKAFEHEYHSFLDEQSEK